MNIVNLTACNSIVLNLLNIPVNLIKRKNSIYKIIINNITKADIWRNNIVNLYSINKPVF